MHFCRLTDIISLNVIKNGGFTEIIRKGFYKTTMERITIKSIFADPAAFADKEITVAGWARNIRTSNAFGFIMLNDGSYFTPLQVVIESTVIDNYKEIASQNIGAALIVKGKITLTPDAPQPFELHATQVEVEGTSTPDYPIQNKRHTPALSRTCAPEQTPITRRSEFARLRLTLSTSSSRTEDSFTPRLPLSQPPTVRARAKCSA